MVEKRRGSRRMNDKVQDIILQMIRETNENVKGIYGKIDKVVDCVSEVQLKNKATETRVDTLWVLVFVIGVPSIISFMFVIWEVAIKKLAEKVIG